MKRITMLAFALVAWLGPAGAALGADDLSIKAFAGHWKGIGEARRPDDLFGLTARDLDVTIKATAAGFNIAWTTVIHPGTTTGSREVKRRSSAVDFVAAGRPGVFKAAGGGDPLSGGNLTWARIKGQTLTVYVLTIGDDGAYTVQSYDRTLTGFGMDLTFTRIKDDEPERVVKGRLVRVED